MPLFGVKYLILIGGAIDMTLGLLLIRSKRSFANHWQTAMAFALCIAVGFGTWFFAELDLNKMSSGVFRHGMAKLEDRNILYAKDGKTASIHVADTNGVRAISTNGKPDAGISLSGEITSDEPTMLLLGALPLAIAQNARDVAVIGMGSGMTSHVVLNDPAIESVDTIEIEKAIIEGAQTFGDKVSNTFNDPRSHIHIEDAKSYFTNRNKKYDVIISEPSNPWVSGVAGLFSEEFYRLIQRHVAEGGLFVQWLHLYEISTPLVATVMGALSPHFTDYAVYMVSNLDIVVVAHKNTAAVPPSDRIFHLPSFDALLKSMKIHSVDDLRIRQIGTKSVLDPFFKSYGMPANSDFYPALDLHAVRTRYLGLNALNILELRTTAIPLFEVLQQEAPGMGITALNEPLHNPLAQNYYNAQQAMQYYKMRKADQIDVNFVIDSTMIITIEDVRTLRTLCKPVLLEQIWLPALHNLFHSLMPFIAAQDMDILWQDIATAPCPDAIPESVQQWINFYQSVSQRDFAAILETAHKLLPEGTIEFSARHEHLIQAAMLAHYVQGNFKQALSLFDRYQHRNKFSVATRLLHQLSTQNLATNTADAATDQ